MNQQDILQKTADYIKREFSDDSSGHDWWHIYRVWKNAVTICEHESGDSFIVQLAALLHDLDDWKFNDSGDETPLRAKAWLDSFSIDPSITDRVCRIITHISYKGAGVKNKMDSLEGFIVQDADRLDAIGLAPGAVREVWSRFLRGEAGMTWSRPWALFSLVRWAAVHHVEGTAESRVVETAAR